MSASISNFYNQNKLPNKLDGINITEQNYDEMNK